MNISSNYAPSSNTSGPAGSAKRSSSHSDLFAAMLGSAQSPEALLEQAKDPDSGFWGGIQESILETAKKNKELRQEEEKIQLLGLMVDNATGKFDEESGFSAAVGLKLGLNADQEIFAKGRVPSELLLYMRTLGIQDSFEITEDPDEDQDSKVNELDGTAAEKLHTGSDDQSGLSEEDLLALAERYDPNNMTREEYDKFLEDLVELGIVSQEAVERIGSLSSQDGGESFYTYTGQNYAPVFQPSPVDSDIESWLQNRLLWKPGITLASAKRDGFVNEYNQIIEEEKTLFRINEILASVKQQRYPNVSL